MKNKTTILLIILILVCTTAYASDEEQMIIKEFEFKTTNEEFSYDVPNEITEDDKEYLLQSIEYEILIEEPVFETETRTFNREVFIENTEKDDISVFDETIYISEDGYEGIIPLKEIVYTERIITGRTASHEVEHDFGLQTEKPKPVPEVETLYHDVETDCDVLVTLQFQRLKETTKPRWEGNITVECMHRSIYEDEYLLNDGTKLQYDKAQPEYKGYEETLLKQMGLVPNKARITGSRWLGATVTENDFTSRLADYTVERLVIGYAAVYTGTFDIPDMLVYDATTIYESDLLKQIETGTEYTVKAIVTYERSPEKDNTVAVVVGTGSGVIALCGLAVFLKKKKKKAY